MTARNRHSHSQRLAACLALLALFAQLWMGQLGTVHLARVLADSAAWLDICVSSDTSRTTQRETAPAAQHIGHSAASLHCSVCVSAAASFAPAATVPPPQAMPEWTLQRVQWAAAPAPGPWRSGLRPPAQAPPAA